MAKKVGPPYTLAKNPNKVKISLGRELELKSAPGKTWNVLKGENVEEIEIHRKHALVDKKGVTIGEAEHTGSVRLVNEPATGKTYAIGDVKCTHKFTKNGKRYIIDGTESMKQEVVVSTSGPGTNGSQFFIEFAGLPSFSHLRIQYLNQDGAPQSVVSVKSKLGNYTHKIHFYKPVINPCKF